MAESGRQEAIMCERCKGRKTVKRSIPVIVTDGVRGCEAHEKQVVIACLFCVPHPVARG